MMEIDASLMPTFERVRASFLRRQESEAQNNTETKCHLSNPFLQCLTRLGYDHEYLKTIVESVVPSMETIFDGKLRTIEFYEFVLSELEMVLYILCIISHA